MKILQPIDPHVHLRWQEYENEPFTQYALQDAQAVGICYLGEMPNTSPHLTSHEVIKTRQSYLSTFDGPPVMIHLGTTTDPVQLVDIFRFARQRDAHGAVKVFFSHSTGNMGLLDTLEQRNIWRVAASLGYEGVIMGHYEDESVHIGNIAFDPKDPKTHSMRQSERSETVQVHRQIGFARDEGFEGTMYICHVSSPDTVDYVMEVKSKEKLRFNIVMEATWHHLFLNWDSYETQAHLVKMNPPLRSPASQKRLLDHLVSGHIDLIGSDHAPHTLSKKGGKNPASGIPALPFWPRGIELLAELGITENEIDHLTRYTAAGLFGLQYLPNDRVDVEYDPTLWEKYGWNPFIEAKLP